MGRGAIRCAGDDLARRGLRREIVLKGALHLDFELLLGTGVAAGFLVASQWLLLFILMRYRTVNLGVEGPLFLDIRKRLTLVIHD